MADYSRYKTATLEKMRQRAWEKYSAETQKPLGNWGDGMRHAKLPQLTAWERARERYDAICAELDKRKAVEGGEYSHIKTAELSKMAQAAFSEYYRLAVKPCTNPSKADLEPLERATERYEAIRAELEKRDD